MALATACTLAFIRGVHATTGINQQLNYQARLLDSTGAIVPDGTYNIEFKIYQDGDGCVSGGSSPCSGTLKWTETRTGSNKVTVRNGYLSVMLGEITAFASSVDWNQDTLWLSINIGGTGSPSWDGEMLPFRRLAATPYALNANQLQGRTAGQFVQLAPASVQADSSTDSSIFINKTGSSGNILQLQKGGTDVTTIGNTGAVTLKNSTNSTAAFQVQNSSGTTVLNVDTTNRWVGIGTTSPQSPLHVNGGSITTPWSITYQHYESAWGSNATRPYLNKGWDATQGDYLYLGATGNGANTGEMAAVFAANQGIKFGTGTDNGGGLNSELMRLTTGGNLGIGLTPSYKLDVSGDANITGAYRIGGTSINTAGTLSNVAYLNQANTFTNTNLFKPSSNSTTALQVQNSSGTIVLNVDTTNQRVGIGTTSPGHTLDVVGGNYTSRIARSTTDTSTAPTTIASATYLQMGGQEYGADSYRLIGFGYHHSSETNTPAYIGYQEKSISGSTKGDLVFGTRSVTTDTAATERMRIDTVGNVGIGSSAPGARLQVNTGADATKGLIVKANSATQSGNLLELQDSSGNALLKVPAAGGLVGYTTNKQPQEISGLFSDFTGYGQKGTPLLIPGAFNKMLYLSSAGGSITADKTPASGSLPQLVDGQGTNVYWNASDAPVSITFTLPASWSYMRQFLIYFYPDYAPSQFSVSFYDASDVLLGSDTQTNWPASQQLYDFATDDSFYGTKKIILTLTAPKSGYNYMHIFDVSWTDYSLDPFAAYLNRGSGGTLYGNVGITQDPSSNRLSILGGSGVNSLLRLDASNGAPWHMILNRTDVSNSKINIWDDNSGNLEICNNSGASCMAYTQGGNVGIGTTGPGYRLDVQSGDINTSGALRIGGTSINTAGTLSNVAYLNQANTFTNTNLIKPSSNSTTAFQVQNSSSTTVFDVDTSNKRVGVNVNNPGYDLAVNVSGSSSGSPTTIGFQNTTGGTYYAFALDGSDGLQAGNGQRTQLYSYWGLELRGNTAAGPPPSFVAGTGSDVGVSVINTTAANKALVVQGASSQSGNLQEWQNSSGTALATVDSSGNIDTTGAYKIGGASINTAGTLSNVAYLNQANTFTGINTFSRNGSGSSDATLAVTGAPVNNATSSLIRIGNSIASGNSTTNGGTYIGLNAPSSGAGSVADFVNFQQNGTSKFSVTGPGVATAATSFLAPLFDTASAVALNIGTTSATGINLNQNTTIASNKSLTANGTAVFKTATNSATAFQIQNTSAEVLTNYSTSDNSIINNGISNPGNLLENGGFEAAVTDADSGTYASGWGVTANGDILTNSSNAHTGNRYLSVTADGGFRDTEDVKQYRVIPGDVVYAEGWINTVSSANGTGGFWVRFIDKDGSTVSYSIVGGSYSAAPTSWTKASGTITVPSSSAYMTMGATVRDTSTTGTWRFDDMFLQKITTNSPWIVRPTADTTTVFQVQNAAASTTVLNVDTTNSRVGIGNAAPGRTIDVTGNWGGSEDDNAQTNNTNGAATATDSTKALVYNLTNNKTSGNNVTTLTFDLTGLPNTNGTFAYVVMRASHNAGLGASAQSCVNLKVNNSTNILAANLCDTVGNSQSNSNYKSFILIRMNGSWTVFGSTSNSAFPSTADLAEWIKTTGRLPRRGELLATADDVKAQLSAEAYDKNLVGIVSTNPNTTYGEQTDDSVAMALTGRVPAVVTALGGAIRAGDDIVASPIPGIGMSPGGSGYSIGKALESFTPSNRPCQDASSYDDIAWPEDTGDNAAKPCFRIPVSSLNSIQQAALAEQYHLQSSDTIYVGKVMVQVARGWVNPTGQLTSSGDLDAAQAGVLNIGSSVATAINLGQDTVVASNKSFTAQGSALFKDATDSAIAFQIQNSQGAQLFVADTKDMRITVKNLVVTGTLSVNGHIITGGDTPGIAAGPAACADSTLSLTGNDTSGSITITTGTGCSASGELATITFSSAYTATPRVMLTPGDAQSASLLPYRSVTPAKFSISTAKQPNDTATYSFDYFISQ